jgi:hypothetical protein
MRGCTRADAIERPGYTALIIRRTTMLTRITKALVAAVLLATAIAASPALAQTKDDAQGAQSNGIYRGHPVSDWTRPDSW